MPRDKRAGVLAKQAVAVADFYAAESADDADDELIEY